MNKNILVFCLIYCFATVNAQEKHIFEFGKETHATNTNIILNTVRFNSEIGFGFDFLNSEKVEIHHHAKTDLGYCSSEHPFYFSVMLPEGKYLVKVLLGNPNKKSLSTIKAEARRLITSNYPLKKNESQVLSFTVDLRSPAISGNDSIRLKPREYNYLNWDNRLSLEFSGKNMAVQRIEITPAKKITTIYLAGNSTVTDQDCEPWASWGQMITPYFTENIAIANYAESGEALASFKGAGRLKKILSLIQPGDYLFIEFGHNDQKRRGEGIGPWLSYSDLLREYVTLAREKGANPVLITPTQRRSFNEKGVIKYTHGDYPAAMRKVAGDLNVPLIDLNEMTKTMYEAWGKDLSKQAFVHYPAGTFPGQLKELKDNTHFNTFGAHEVALCILKGIHDLDLDIRGDVIGFDKSYSPSKPNDPTKWKLPPSPRYISTKPEGN